jgi:hypothetical protein
MLLRRLVLVLLSSASLVTSSFSGMGSGALNPPAPGGGSVEITITLPPPQKVCKGVNTSIAISYQFIMKSLLDPQAPHVKGKNVLPPPVSGSGQVSEEGFDIKITPTAWTVKSLKGLGVKSFTYRSDSTGIDIVTFTVVLNGSTATKNMEFVVVDCSYHVGLTGHLVFPGGGAIFHNMKVDVVWNAGGPIKISEDGIHLTGTGRGDVVQTYTGAGLGETCVPTNKRSGNGGFRVGGSLDSAGLRLGFLFDPLVMEQTPIKCSVVSTMVELPIFENPDLNKLSISTLTTYKDEAQTFPFSFFGGKGKLEIYKAYMDLIK